MVKCTNTSMGNVLKTLSTTDIDKLNVINDLEAGEIMDIDNIDPNIMLY